jgi:hypothetical protein
MYRIQNSQIDNRVHNPTLFSNIRIYGYNNLYGYKKIDKQTHSRYCIVIYSILLFNTQFYLTNGELILRRFSIGKYNAIRKIVHPANVPP